MLCESLSEFYLFIYLFILITLVKSFTARAFTSTDVISQAIHLIYSLC